MGRQTRRTLAEMSEEEQKVFEEISRGRKTDDGHIGGPFDVWLLNAEMGRRITGLGGMFRFRTSVDRRYIELAILITGQFWEAQFEWYAHEPMAREAGLPDSVISAVKAGQTPGFDDEKDAACFKLCHELHHQHRVSDETFKSAAALFGEQGVAEIINVSGYYTMVCMTLNTFDVDLPDGAEKPFPD